MASSDNLALDMLEEDNSGSFCPMKEAIVSLKEETATRKSSSAVEVGFQNSTNEAPGSGSIECPDAEKVGERPDFPDDFDYTEYGFFDITPNKDSGVTKRIMKEGIGNLTPEYGDQVKIHYKCFVINTLYNPGSISNLQGVEDTVEYSLGKNVCRGAQANSNSVGPLFSMGKKPLTGSMIKGLELGIQSMKMNEVARFICQPSYAFGHVGQPPYILPDQDVLFEVQLISFCKEDLSRKKDRGILRKYLVKPNGASSPNDGALVKVHITGYYNLEIFDDREVDFVLGEGCTSNIPEGIEIALLKFRTGEKSKLFIASKYAFGTEGKPANSIPPNADVEYDVFLIEFQKIKDIWEMNPDEKLSYALEAKEKGTKFFRSGYLKAALNQYKRVVKYLRDEPGVPLGEEQYRQELLLTGYLNTALCHLKLLNSMDVIKMCDKALEIDPINEKALFRRGQARFQIEDFSEALGDYEKVVSLYPGNSAAQNSVGACKVRIKMQKDRERQLYGHMFKKFAEEDEAWRKQQQNKTETGVWCGQVQEHGQIHSHSIEDDEEIVKMLNKQNLYGRVLTEH